MLACLGVRFCTWVGLGVFLNLAGLGFERVRVPPWAEVFALGEIATQCSAELGFCSTHSVLVACVFEQRFEALVPVCLRVWLCASARGLALGLSLSSLG